ncbi:MAG: exo-alpha-sialidase [Bacteroidetes bacterium]|nr:exo-alpha-sialidase [Bacteroidota bacterium]
MKNVTFLLAIFFLGLSCQNEPGQNNQDDKQPLKAEVPKINLSNLAKDEGFIYDVAEFPSAHASTLVELPDHTIMAAWFGGTHEKHKDVGIWTAQLKDGEWSKPVEVANGVQNEELRFPTWNPVLHQSKAGPLMLFYKVGPDPSNWWGMVITSEDGGKTWSEPRKLGDNLIGPVRNKALEFDNGLIVAPSSDEANDEWIVHVERSEDGGKSWTRSAPLNDPNEFAAIQPTLLVHKDGRLQMLCRSKQGVITTSFSSDSGKTWTPMKATKLPNPNSGIDAVTMKDGRHLLVYNPTTTEKGKWGGPRTPLSIGFSFDGERWMKALDLETEEGEYSYPAVIQSSDGKIHITYTWRRERIKYVVLEI